MNDPFLPLLYVAIFLVMFGGCVGFFADYMRRKYEALAESESSPADHPGS